MGKYFTDYKDKHGTPILVGDKLRGDNGHEGVVIYDERGDEEDNYILDKEGFIKPLANLGTDTCSEIIK